MNGFKYIHDVSDWFELYQACLLKNIMHYACKEITVFYSVDILSVYI